MKEIFVDVYPGIFHPCDVLGIRSHLLTGIENIYLFDRVNQEYLYARLYEVKGVYYIDDVNSLSDVNAFKRLIEAITPKGDLSMLPLYLRNIRRLKGRRDEICKIVSGIHDEPLIKRLEFLELISYCDAVLGPIYYYFIIRDVELTSYGYVYTLDFSEESLRPLNKNIIARHETLLSKENLFHHGEYRYVYNENEVLRFDMNIEKRIALKIMELEKSKRRNIDTAVLTRVVRYMLREENIASSAREYQRYMSDYYDKWLYEKQKKYRR